MYSKNCDIISNMDIESLEEIKEPKVTSLGKSLSFGFFFFIITMCVVISILSHISYKISLYKGYKSHMADILNYIKSAVDNDDLEKCINNIERSPKYDELVRFMDGIKEDFNIHYLYIIKPLNHEPTGNVMSVISAENYYDRFINTEGNLYLGWISDDEFDQKTVDTFFSIMENQTPVYFEEKTEWGTDYTGAIALRNSKREAYAILAVDIDISYIKTLLLKQALSTIGLILILGGFFTIQFLLWTQKNITKPIEMLSDTAASFVEKSHGKRNINLLKFDAPDLKTNNEIKNLSDAITQMTQDMKHYVEGIISAELEADLVKKQADSLHELANKDALTGVRNKTSYDKEILKLDYELETGRHPPFGIAMIDLNYLKKLNDTYGHDKGNLAIKKLCTIVCDIFGHSPVFRIGGDEFVVILKGTDLQNIEELHQSFNNKMKEFAENQTLEPWEKVSAAIGIAIFGEESDKKVIDVFKRADQKMYDCKKAMKCMREA